MDKKFLNIFLILFFISLTTPQNLGPAGNKIKGIRNRKSFIINREKTNFHKNYKSDSSKITGKEIINHYISAIGGKNILNRITDRTTYITGKVRNMNIHILVYQKIPNMYFQKIELGATDQKIIFNGKKGVMITNDNKQEMKGLELEKLKYEATMQLLLYLNAYDVKAEYKGIEKANGFDAYKVILNFPDNMKWTEYYDTTTYLRVKELKPINSPGEQPVSQESFFSNYQGVNGVKYPFIIKQFLGPSKFEFYVDSIKVNTGLSNRNFEIE